MDVDEPAAKRKKISGFPVCSSHALGPFYLRNQLGSGSTCLVFHAKSTKSLAPLTPRDSVGPRYVAVKVVPIGQADEVKKKKILREVRIHETLRHPHVLEMITGEEREEKGAWPKGLYIVLQLATGGDLFDKIPPEVGLPDRMAHLYFTQMVSGLKYLASQGIVHRDIKPENILLDQFGNLKITDFGLATVFKYKGQTRLLTDRCGSAPYAAPEVHASVKWLSSNTLTSRHNSLLATLPTLANQSTFGQQESCCSLSSSAVRFPAFSASQENGAPDFEIAEDTPWDEPTVASPDFAAYVSSEIWSYDPWDRINDKQRSVLLGVLTIDPKHRLRLPDIEQTEWFRIVNPLIDDATGLVQNPMMVGRMLSEHLRRHELIGEPTSAFDEMCQEMDAVNLEEQNGAPPPLSQATQRMLENKGCNPGAGFAASMQMATRLSAAPSQRLNPNTKRFFTTVAPMQIVEYLVNALTQLLVPHEVLQDAQETPAGIPFIVRVRFEHIDTRKQPLVGSIAISEGHLEADDVTGQSAVDGYDVVAHRKEGNPLELTKFWQDVKRLLPPGVVQVM